MNTFVSGESDAKGLSVILPYIAVGPAAVAIRRPELKTTQHPTIMNILNKQCNALAPNFGRTHAPTPKREKFSWAEPCSLGTFIMIKKQDLNIDGSYQRDQVSKSKVLDIARDWDWKLFGTLSVIMRKDMSFWVYDGGHRCRASFLRDDITELPCMVFQADDEKTEARAFVGANTMKSIVSAYHKHRAAVLTGEPVAVMAQSILEKNGYFAAQCSSTKYGFAAINALLSQVKEDAVLAEKVFTACAIIGQDGEPFSGELLDAMYVCQKKLEGKADIFKGEHIERLKTETLSGIESAIRREKHIAGKGGANICAKAVLDLLNKKRKRRLLFN